MGTDNGISSKGWPKGPALGHCSARRIAQHLVRGGTPSVYMYHFERPLMHPLFADHSTEVFFVLNSALTKLAPGNRYLSYEMIQYWTRFAAAGTPNPADTHNLPHWPTYAPDGDKANIRFDATWRDLNITIEHGLRGPACAFWDSIAAAPVSSMVIV